MSVLDGGSRRVHQRRSARLRGALARFDEATITTIHGFCQQATAQSGIRAAGDPGVELVEDNATVIAEVCRDLVLPRLLDDPLALSTDRNDNPVGPTSTKIKAPSKVEGYIAQAVRAVLYQSRGAAGPGARPRHAARPVGRNGRRHRRRRRGRGNGRVGRSATTGLITDLRDLLADPDDGPALAEQLAHRYRLVLVDEFQDTDRLQWEVFDASLRQPPARSRSATRSRRSTASAAPTSTPTSRRCATSERTTLGTNHRSDRAAARRARRALPRRDPRPPRHPVPAASTRRPTRLVERARRRRRAPHPGRPRRPVRRPHIERHDLSSAPSSASSLADVAARIRDLLDDGTITDANGRRPSGCVRATSPCSCPPSAERRDVAAALRQWCDPVGAGPHRLGARQRRGHAVAAAARRPHAPHARQRREGGRARLVLRSPDPPSSPTNFDERWLRDPAGGAAAATRACWPIGCERRASARSTRSSAPSPACCHASCRDRTATATPPTSTTSPTCSRRRPTARPASRPACSTRSTR